MEHITGDGTSIYQPQWPGVTIDGIYPVVMRKRHSTRIFLISGFAVMLVYHLWMYFLFIPDMSFKDLLLPVFLRGVASGLLFVPLIIFILPCTPGYTGTTGLIMATMTRFISLLNSIAGFYNLQLYFNQYFKTGFYQQSALITSLPLNA